MHHVAQTLTSVNCCPAPIAIVLRSSEVPEYGGDGVPDGQRLERRGGRAGGVLARPARDHRGYGSQCYSAPEPAYHNTPARIVTLSDPTGAMYMDAPPMFMECAA